MSNRRTTNQTLWIVLIVLAILILAPLLWRILAFPMMGMGGGMMGGMWGGGMGGGFGGSGVSPIWSLVMLLVWVVILVGGGYVVYRWLSGTRGIGSDPALEELRLAYARGDISEEEFEQRRSKLAEE